MNIINIIKDFVEAECKKPTSKYWYEPYLFHFIPMVDYAEKLINELWWDKEIVLISAWLHDIGSIVYWRKDHHITWAEIAEKKLKELNYPPQKIELVKKCILNHRWSQKNKRTTIEEQIVVEADVISNFDNISGIFKAAFVYENLSQWEAKAAVRQKLIQKWEQLHFEKSKKIIKPKFEAAMLLFT